MSQNISLFSDYQQRENRLTNYCGLILKMVYEESPAAFEDVLSVLIQDEEHILVGPRFSQQQKAKKSIPDLVIRQEAFEIFVETKIGDWFYDDQLKRHTEGLSTCGTKILVLLSNTDPGVSTGLEQLKKELSSKGITVLRVSFEDLVTAIREKTKAYPRLTALMDEFEDFLNRRSLLPTWKHLLTVVNAAKSLYTFNDFYYSCPDTGGSYSHHRARYMGAYADKEVKKICEIEAVVAVPKNATSKEEIEIRYFNVDTQGGNDQKDEFKKRAWDIVQANEDLKDEITHQYGIQVFLLGKAYETSFKKDSRGGMFGSKQYFWDIDKDCKNAEDLAAKLKGKKWQDFKD